MLKRGKFRQHGLLPDFSKDRASLFARGQKLIRINFAASSCPQFSGSLQPVRETSAHRVKMRTTLSSQSSYPQFWQAELWITAEKGNNRKIGSGKSCSGTTFPEIRSDISFSIPALSAMLKRGKFRQHGLLPDFSKDRASLFARGQKLIRINFAASSCPQFSGSLQPVRETSAHRVKMRTTLSSQSSYPQFWQAELWITTEDVRLSTAKAGSHLDIKCIHLIP